MTTAQHETLVPVAAGNVTRNLVEVGRAVRYAELPGEIRDRVKHCVLDIFGCMILGSESNAAAWLRDVVQPESPVGTATVFGARPQRARPVDAALINGHAAHVLDFDDGNQTARAGHLSCTVVCAALAIGESINASGADVIAAIVAGYETSARLGMMLGPVHYAAGFHSTGTLGSISSAAAASHLLGLDEQRWTMALGIAGTQAAGLKASFGTLGKPLHAGRAASNGVLSALLARRGFTGASDIIGARNGFAWTQSSSPDYAAAARPLGPPYAVESMNFKYHAACFGTHSAIDAMTQLRTAHSIDPDKVAQIFVRIPARSLDNCNIPSPRNGTEAKFSVRFTTAAALLGWDTSEAGFTDDAKIVDPEIVSVIDRISVEGVQVAARSAPTEIEIVFHDGQRLINSFNSRAEFNPWGSLDVEWDQLVDKFRRLTAPVLDARVADRVIGLIHGLDTLMPVTTLSQGFAHP
jgi:2-methylcitrate dehydratase PrpD